MYFFLILYFFKSISNFYKNRELLLKNKNYRSLTLEKYIIHMWS